MNVKRLALAVAISAVSTAPAYAQRYTATQNGDVVELVDTSAQMNVSVVWSMSNAWRVQVKGRTSSAHRQRLPISRPGPA
jgi:hypothetical protein